MKYLLLAVLLCCAAGARAQAVSSAALAPAPYRYCALVVADRLFSAPGRLGLD